MNDNAFRNRIFTNLYGAGIDGVWAMSIISDSDIVQWLEDHHTLHISVEMLYVVDGYEVSICYDDTPHRTVKADTLREAFVKIMTE